MPLTQKGRAILEKMRDSYRGAPEGADKKAKSVFYAMVNSGKLKGVHEKGHHSPPTAAEENAHKGLAKEVAGGLRKLRFGKQ